jgi:cutinase
MMSLKIVAIIVAVFIAPFVVSPATAHAGCPDVEVVFARGTFEAPGVGGVGQAFVDALRHHTRHNVSVYAVNYPASMDFGGSGTLGVQDILTHVEANALSCPGTEEVIAGYSQGAAVAGYSVASVVPPGVSTTLVPMPISETNFVAAVVLFGSPSPNFLGMFGEPPVVVGDNYVGRTDNLCAPDDMICAGGGNMDAHNSYVSSGLVDQGASFAAGRL